MSGQNKKIALHVIEEVLNRQNYAAADELLASDFVGHTQPQDIQGAEGLKQFCIELHQAFPNFHCNVEDQIAEGDRVVTRWTARGTHKAAFMGIPATGKQGNVTGIYIDRIVNGKIVETWTEWDALGMMQQLGVIPTHEQG